MCDSLPWTPMNRRTKYDATSFILSGKIRNRTNKQTVTDISTPCLSTCVNKNITDKKQLAIKRIRYPSALCCSVEKKASKVRKFFNHPQFIFWET